MKVFKTKMFNISSYLEKLKKSLSSSEDQKKIILGIIEKNTKIVIQPNDLEIKNYTICIAASPAVKNKLFMYKDKILEEVSLSLPNLKIGNIK